MLIRISIAVKVHKVMELRKITNALFVFILYILARTAAQVAVIPTCSNCPNITLGTTEKSIIYESNNSNCRCSWTLPNALVRADSYSIAVVQLNASLIWEEFGGCAATIAFPDRSHTCNERYKCRIYHTRTTKCNDSEVIRIMNKKGFPCNDLTRYHSSAVKKIDYAAYGMKIAKRFNIRYIPINCNPSSTTTPQPKDVSDGTTLNPAPTYLTKNETSGTGTTKESYLADDLNTTNIQKSSTLTEDAKDSVTTGAPDPKTKPDASKIPSSTVSEPSQSRRRIMLIRIVIPLTILLALLVIAAVLLILWYRGNTASKQATPSPEAEKTMALNDEQETRV